MAAAGVRLAGAVKFWVRPYKALLAMVLVASLAGMVATTWRWPLVGDAPLMHEVVWLMQRGWAPYRQIADINLPGTYAAEALVMRWLGPGALAWRVYDFGLLAWIGLGMARLCPPRQRAFAGLFAGGLFALLHARDGLIETGQRDLLVTALLVGGYVCLFRAMHATDRPGVPAGAPAAAAAGLGRAALGRARFERAGFGRAGFGRRRLWQYGASAAFGLLLGAAATVKPHALALLAALLVLLAVALRKQGHGWARLVGVALVGSALPVAAMVVFLYRWHAFQAFAVAMGSLVPLHASMLRLPLYTLLGRSVSSVMLPMVVLWLPVAWARRGALPAVRLARGFAREQCAVAALWIGVLFGVGSFCLQGRGYAYHRYPLEAFLLVLLARDLSAALDDRQDRTDRRRWVAGMAALALGVGVLWIVPRSLAVAAHYTWQRNGFDALLEPVLAARGGASLNGAGLSGHVQCLDMAGGCVSTLYRMRLLPSTGYLYDCYLFVPTTSARAQAEQARYRAAFLQAMEAARPAYLIATSDECGITPPDFAYSKLTRWPAFAAWLAAHYALVTDRRPREPEAWEGRPALPYGFRLYRQKP